MTNQTDKLIEAFTIVAKQHHDAFLGTNGYDPEWPTWYAIRLKPLMHKILHKNLEIKDLAESLKHLDSEYHKSESTISWQEYYSNHFE